MNKISKGQLLVFKIAAVAAVLAFLIRPVTTVNNSVYVGYSPFYDAVVGGGDYTGTLMRTDVRLLVIEYVALAVATVVASMALSRTKRS